ncbi:MAG: hypothetical protein ACI4L9_03260, partial [Candidatus Coproplasma sp.]
AFKKYEIKELTQDFVFMCDAVPCRLNDNFKVLTLKNQPINFYVESVNNNKIINRGDLIAELKIYSQNNLIFSQNLYSIIDRK